MSNRHNVFISYHHDIIVSKSVQMGDINVNIQTDTIRQKIRDEYLRDSTVTLVLIGKETWKRKHVDWEIGSSIRSTQYSPRSGLLGIFLPTHSDYGRDKYDPYICPPRLHQNVDNSFAKLYDWNTNPDIIQSWIHEAFERRNKIIPNNSYPSFVNNRSGERWQ